MKCIEFVLKYISMISNYCHVFSHIKGLKYLSLLLSTLTIDTN